MATLRNSSTTILLTALLSVASPLFLAGCGSSSYIGAAASSGGSTNSTTTSSYLALNPVTATSTVNGSLGFAPVEVNSSTGATTAVNPATCNWTSSDETVLGGGTGGSFKGIAEGSATVTAACSNLQATATAAVALPQNPNAIRITHGGVYTGNWSTNDPTIPAVMVITDEPVTITNSTVTGPSTLILVYGTNGANVTVTNTTGIALDPGVSGMAKGKFIDAQVMSSLTVQHCTMTSTSFGVYIYNSANLTSLNVSNNVGVNLDDRVSDGKGGYLLNQRVLGHFIMFNGVIAPNGGTIAWNQIINAPGVSSIEDVLEFYQGRGGDANHLVSVHDNYLQGAFATGQTTAYTGSGMQFDGGTNDPLQATGYFDITNNVVVRSANWGISIAAGHDINIHGNRVVSCGQDGEGNWINFSGYAYGLWNYYNTQQVYNNTISGNTGGLVILKSTSPAESNFYTPVAGQQNNVVSGNTLDQPCWAGGAVTQTAEATELTNWQEKVAAAGMTLGAGQ